MPTKRLNILGNNMTCALQDPSAGPGSLILILTHTLQDENIFFEQLPSPANVFYVKSIYTHANIEYDNNFEKTVP